MIRIPKSVLTLGGVVIAAGALTLAVPRAAHAVAATLVTVANTASNPAVTQSTYKQAAQLVYINANLVPNTTSSFFQIGPGLDGASVYTVPAGQNLVITAADILPGSSNGCPSGQFTFVLSGNSPIAAEVTWAVAAPNMGHFEYPSGIVFGPGSTPIIEFVYASNMSGNCANGANVNLFGYLTPS